MYFTEYTKMLEGISLHQVGNKSAGDRLSSTEELFVPDETIRTTLNQYFSSGFKPGALFQFYHETDLNLNEVFVYARKIFEDKNLLHTEGKNIAVHLYNQSTHPKIKSGELYIVYFEECVLEGEVVDAIGIFKSETKEPFLNVQIREGKAHLTLNEGISIQRPDKSCLIFNTEGDSGYVVAIADHLSKGSEAIYWKDDFLKVKERNNYYSQTVEFLNITHEFVTQQMDEEFEVTKADKIDFLNRSVEYFKQNESFDREEFVQEVFDAPNLISSFNEFDKQKREELQLQIPDEFKISETAVKKKARVFKSILKLDKNFHIYIHGDRSKIEQGEDEHGRYYKIYYEQEF